MASAGLWGIARPRCSRLEIGTAFLDLEPIDASGLELSEIAS